MLRIERTNLCVAVVEETRSYNSTAINGRQIEQAEPSDGPFAQGWQQARGTPREVPPTHAANPGPGYLERFPVGRPSGEGLSLNIVIQYYCGLHWHQTVALSSQA